MLVLKGMGFITLLDIPWVLTDTPPSLNFCINSLLVNHNKTTTKLDIVLNYIFEILQFDPDMNTLPCNYSD